ncbi:MAG: hypothetical protein H8D23_17620 [Candidatus Brocadiales bacterium]|nr:hypothetical protein [Candidatus Brocadiales bacterium]
MKYLTKTAKPKYIKYLNNLPPEKVEPAVRNIARGTIRRAFWNDEASTLAEALSHNPGLSPGTRKKLLTNRLSEAVRSDYKEFLPGTDSTSRIHQLRMETSKSYKQEKLKQGLQFRKSERERHMAQKPKTWADGSKVDPEEIVTITHGGGKDFINRFLKGEEKGYRLERGGKGIQVHPNIKGTSGIGDSRTSFYSRRAIQHFDTPAGLKGQIKAKYLDSANNSYEAGIRPENAKYLKKAKVTPTGATSDIAIDHEKLLTDPRPRMRVIPVTEK